MRVARAGTRVAVAAAVGIACFAVLIITQPWQVALLGAWDLAAAVMVGWIVAVTATMSPSETERFATREDTSRAVADALLVAACVASLAGIAFLLVKASQQHGSFKAVAIGLAVLSVVLSWLLVHVVFTLRYADLYYRDRGGIDFNSEEEPDYHDFAYLALTIGMTYQVSDTDLTSRQMRRTATRHALLSFLFGTMVIALTINVVAGLLNR